MGMDLPFTIFSRVSILVLATVLWIVINLAIKIWMES